MAPMLLFFHCNQTYNSEPRDTNDNLIITTRGASNGQ